MIGEGFQYWLLGISSSFPLWVNVKFLNVLQLYAHPGDLAPLLWDSFLHHDLTEVMCQRDVQFSTALNYIRMNVPEKGSSEDKMLQSCELHLLPDHDGYPRDAMHVYAQNAYCAEWNNTRLDQLDTMLYTCTAQDFSKDRNTNLANITFPSNPRDTGNLLSVLNVKVGACVMLTTNIDVCDGAYKWCYGYCFRSN